MRWANFLHLYQPANQQPEIVEAVTNQSYRPVLSSLANYPNAKLTLNINSILLELFDKQGFTDIIDLIRAGLQSHQIELTGSGKYHPLLPFLADDDIIRQITINTETLRFYLGSNFTPQGFFPPEMAYDPKLAPIVESLGFKWIIMDEIAFSGKTEELDTTKLYQIAGTKLDVVFRQRRVSNLIMSAMVRTSESLLSALAEERVSPGYVVTGMDCETFGHHRPGLEKLLFDIFSLPEFDLLTVSELLTTSASRIPTTPLRSTWAASEENMSDQTQFISWLDPENPVHPLQWQLFHLASKTVRSLAPHSENFKEIREQMDIASASDHYFWASTKPWWSVEMIEEGAYLLLNTLKLIPQIDKTLLQTAQSLYDQILSKSFEINRTLAKSRQKKQILPSFKNRTETEPWIFDAFLDILKTQEEIAAKKREYEAATMWRDAAYKLENGLDMYDAVHAIDLLRLKLPNAEIEHTLDEYTTKYKRIRGGQPEQRS